ncbi:glycosyltransferase [Sphingobacterium sp. R2]|uniref:glycosyltransferase n=1 Tax=Sphingobacterium sp. R2 TaxID=3112958 RepID=UPI00345D6E61
MNNNIIRSFWKGGHLSNLEKLSIASYINNGHTFELFVYDDIREENLHSKLIIRDANEILHQNLLFLDSRYSYASFADWFRFKMLFELGGWWTDLDSVCIKPLDFTNDYCFSTEGNPRFPIINCGNIKTVKESEFLDECLFYINDLRKNKNRTWGKYGIMLLRTVLKNYEIDKYKSSPNHFCPIFYKDISKLIDRYPPKIPNESYAIHFWNGMWNLRNWNKNSPYPTSSIFETLKSKYLNDSI